jgi:hypothetical protein
MVRTFGTSGLNLVGLSLEPTPLSLSRLCCVYLLSIDLLSFTIDRAHDDSAIVDSILPVIGGIPKSSRLRS